MLPARSCDSAGDKPDAGALWLGAAIFAVLCLVPDAVVVFGCGKSPFGSERKGVFGRAAPTASRLREIRQ